MVLDGEDEDQEEMERWEEETARRGARQARGQSPPPPASNPATDFLPSYLKQADQGLGLGPGQFDATANVVARDEAIGRCCRSVHETVREADEAQVGEGRGEGRGAKGPPCLLVKGVGGVAASTPSTL